MDVSFYTWDVVNALSLLTIVGQVISICIFLLLLKDIFTKSEGRITRWVSKYGLLLMLIVTLTATCGSLFFSEIAGWTPCKDCWLQRIFMYPQVILLVIALWKKDRKIAMYILPLCIIGAIIAFDHYSDQVKVALHPIIDKENGVNALLKPCDASGVSCASTQIQFAYGYITIPMMALTAFILNAIGSVLILRKRSV